MRPLRIAKHGRFWKRGHARFLIDQRWHQARNTESGYGDEDHLQAAVAWLERAQDATPDGGIVVRYRLDRGWTSSYPETTGYIVPTLLQLARQPGLERLRDRAARAVEFLRQLQLPSGAFPGAEIAENRERPSPFNTAQIVHGLVAWHREVGDDSALEAAKRAGEWLCSVQDDDGAFRQHFYNDVATAYSAYLSCWIAELGQHCGEQSFLDAASGHLDWLLELQDPQTGWFERSGFDQEQIEARVAFTHTIAYTVQGVLTSAEILGREDGIEAARRAALGMQRRLELAKQLPGLLDWRWRSGGEFCCLTGNAQMALVWFQLFERDGDPRLLNAALKAIDEVKARQPMHNANPGLRGGIPGSAPAWGDYIRMGVPNWAAKYFLDALLEKRRILDGLSLPVLPRTLPAQPLDVPARLPARSDSGRTPKLRVGVLSTPRSRKLAKLLAACDAFEFTPALVLLEDPPPPSKANRVGSLLEQEGASGLVRRLQRRLKPASAVEEVASGRSWARAAEECRARGIETHSVPNLQDEAGLSLLRDQQIDLLVLAGAGILRSELLAIPRLGTLNAHMGLLPTQRGMNVTEWAAFTGAPVGCTVHLVDSGIDTGEILWA